MFRFAVITALGVVALASAGCSGPAPTPVNPTFPAPGPLTGNSETICSEWDDLYTAYNIDDTDSAAAAKAYFAAVRNGTPDARRVKIDRTYFHEQAEAVWDLAKQADDPRVRTVLTAHLDELNAQAAGKVVTTTAAHDVKMTCWAP
ncbi:hypothetical protein ACIBSW_23070 [Actinoplanes sp. NPDC049668]|uniref:hypothetical protein n=1 Tax=unclassified Actinoplanes TaxID=2626549 RepID=UPI0033B289B0